MLTCQSLENIILHGHVPVLFNSSVHKEERELRENITPHAECTALQEWGEGEGERKTVVSLADFL